MHAARPADRAGVSPKLIRRRIRPCTTRMAGRLPRLRTHGQPKMSIVGTAVDEPAPPLADALQLAGNLLPKVPREDRPRSRACSRRSARAARPGGGSRGGGGPASPGCGRPRRRCRRWHAAVVEEGVALGRRAVGDHGRPSRRARARKARSALAAPLDPGAEPGVGSMRSRPAAASSGPDVGEPRRRSRPARRRRARPKSGGCRRGSGAARRRTRRARAGRGPARRSSSEKYEKCSW